MSLSDKIIAAVRTAVAAGVAVALLWVAARVGVSIPDEVGEAVTVVLVGLVAAGYNLAVNWLTANVWDGFGYLLGVAKTPTYGE